MSSPIEIVAVVFSLLSTYFSIRKSVWCWIFGTVAVSAYFLLFYQIKLYADLGLQVMYLLQGFYGIYGWMVGQKQPETFVRRLSVDGMDVNITLTLLLTCFIGVFLDKWTDASSPYVDALASSTSLIANWLLAKRYLQNWFFWITADIILIGLFWYKVLYLSSCIYFIFLLLCIKGYLDWNKSATKEPSR